MDEHKRMFDICRTTMKDVLRVEEVGDEESFFELGGTSIAAARWMQSIADRAGITVRLSDVFASPTVAQLVPRLVERSGQVSESATVDAGTWPATENQSVRLVGRRHNDATGTELPTGQANIISVGFRLTGHLAVERLSAAVDAVIDRHSLLSAVFDVDSLQVRSAPRSFGLEHRAASELTELRKPFPFDSGQLSRFYLVTQAEQVHDLWVAVEHIAADVRSFILVLRDLATFYNRLAAGEELGDIRHRGVPGVGLGRYQAQLADSPAGGVARAFLREQTTGVPLWHPLTSEHVHVPTKQQRRQSLGKQGVLLADEVAELNARCAAEGGSILAAVVAAVTAAITGVLHTADLTLYCVVANRTSELSETVGTIAAVVPVRTVREGRAAQASQAELISTVNQAVASSVYDYDRFSREEGQWAAYEDCPIVVVNVLSKHPAEPIAFHGLDLHEFPQPDDPSPKLTVSFTVDYSSDRLTLDATAPVGLISAEHMGQLVDQVLDNLRHKDQ